MVEEVILWDVSFRNNQERREVRSEASEGEGQIYL